MHRIDAWQHLFDLLVDKIERFTRKNTVFVFRIEVPGPYPLAYFRASNRRWRHLAYACIFDDYGFAAIFLVVVKVNRRCKRVFVDVGYFSRTERYV